MVNLDHCFQELNEKINTNSYFLNRINEFMEDFGKSSYLIFKLIFYI